MKIKINDENWREHWEGNTKQGGCKIKRIFIKIKHEKRKDVLKKNTHGLMKSEKKGRQISGSQIKTKNVTWN